MYDTHGERGRPEETALDSHSVLSQGVPPPALPAAPHAFFRSLSSDKDLINPGSKYAALVTYSPGASNRLFPIGSFAWV